MIFWVIEILIVFFWTTIINLGRCLSSLYSKGFGIFVKLECRCKPATLLCVGDVIKVLKLLLNNLLLCGYCTKVWDDYTIVLTILIPYKGKLRTWKILNFVKILCLINHFQRFLRLLYFDNFRYESVFGWLTWCTKV